MARAVVLAVLGAMLGIACGDGGEPASLPPPDGGPAPSSWHDGLPFSRGQMLDQSTLSPTIHSDTLVPSQCAPGASNRLVEVSYFSHSWHDGDWYGTTTVLIPEFIEHAGIMALGDIESDWMDCTANQLGIPVASVPDSDEHFGLTEIHDVYEHILCEMIARDDIFWAPYWPFAALRMRAVTLVGQLLGQPIEAAYTFGSSINGSLSYATALYDDRVEGVAATGAYGHLDSFMAEPADADLYYAWCATGCNPYAMPAELRAELLAVGDLHVIGPELEMPMLQVVPTNDVNATHLLLPEAFSTVAGGVHVASVPNGVHSTAPPRVAELFRMWIEHVAWGRPVNAIESVELAVEGSELVARAHVVEAAVLEEVRLFFVPVDDDTYFGHPFWWTTPDDNYSTAHWDDVPMLPVGDHWEARLPLPSTRFVAALADAVDQVDGQRGYVSSLVQLWPLRADAESDLCDAIAADCRLDVEGSCRRFLERCLQGCPQSFARCIKGHALDFCDEAVTAMCLDATAGCLDDPCRDAYAQCADSGFTSCAALYGGCLEPCEQALFEVAYEQSAAALDTVLDECGLGGR